MSTKLGHERGARKREASLSLEPGDAVPADLAVVDRHGEQLPVTSFRGRPVLLIYLRHLA